jgi:hypothetical protein
MHTPALAWPRERPVGYNGSMEEKPNRGEAQPVPALEEGDYYLEGPNLVFTAGYHLKRGYCCQSGCRDCPYGFVAGEVLNAAEAEDPDV